MAAISKPIHAADVVLESELACKSGSASAAAGAAVVAAAATWSTAAAVVETAAESASVPVAAPPDASVVESALVDLGAAVVDVVAGQAFCIFMIKGVMRFSMASKDRLSAAPE